MAPIVKFVELPGRVTLPYVEQGDPEGAPMLLLHGYADSWRAFDLVLPHLPASIHTFALTQRGHADASRPATGYGSRDFATDLAAFIDALSLERPVIVGASSGGFVARRFAIDHPDRTRGLVLLGSPATLSNKPGVLDLWNSTVSKLRDPIDEAFVRGFQQGALARPVPLDFLEAMVQDNLKVPAHVWKATFEGLIEDDSLAELGKIKAPTLVIWGDQDALLPRTDQEKLTGAIAGSRLLVYAGAGHALYWEEPERVAADLVAFVQSLAAYTATTVRTAHEP